MASRMPATDALRQVEADHVDLRERLRVIRRALVDEKCTDEALALVHGLLERLEVHFRHEEEGGYFREVAYRAPQLARLATTLEHEHPQLLHRLRGISAHLEVCQRSALRLPKVAAAFLEFATALMSHEEDEQRLIQESFNSELECSD